MSKQGVVSIGLQVSYEESLDKMLNDFRATLKQVSNDAERIKWDSNMAKSFEAIQKRIDSVETDFKGMFDELNSQKLSTEKFEAYQKEISSSLGKIETDIKGLTGQFENLGNNDYVSKMVSQFKFLQENIKDTQRELGKVVDFTSSSSVIDLDIVKQVGEYKKAIKDIQNLRDNAELPSVDLSNIEKAKLAYKELYDLFVSLEGREFDLQDEFDVSSADKKLSIERELYSVRQQMVNTLESLQELYSKIGSKNLGDFEDPNKIVAFDSKGIDEYIENATNFIQQNEKMVESYKETQSQLDALVTEFKVKNGAIHIPIEIDKIGADHKNQLMSALNKLQAELDKKNIIAKVKLTLDDGSSKGRKKNADFDQQQKDGQKKPVADLTPSIAKAYREGAKIAEETVKAGMAEIQKAFEKVPVTFKLDTDAFKTDLKAMIDDSFKAIAEDTTGLNVNSELEKLVGNLKEVSSSISGNENFKFGLDEDSITRITDAIKNMADMIQRAFGVASNDDIAAQWTAVESKFKSAAGEEGKLLKGNKEHKIAIQELAVEYKKYLDMGGKNDLSELTTHKQTIKNIAAEYESLGKAAQEAAQKQEKVAKKPASKKVSSEEKEAINAVSRENKKLETQAGRTGTALDNEGKKAQSAAEKFRKLAKEKGAAVVANRELAKAAKETADALEREAKVRKSGAGKTNKNAVDEGVYSSSYLKWQSDIEGSLRDSGNYSDVYEAKISQATNGTVKFTAVVRTLDGELKKFSASVKDTGEMFAPSVSEMGEKQAADFEKRLKIAEKDREAMAAMDAEGVEPVQLDEGEMRRYSDNILVILKDLEKLSKNTYKIDLNDDGKLVIARKNIADTGAEAEAFTVTIDRIDDILEKTADDVVVSSEKIEKALSGAFGSAKISTSTKDLASKAQEAFDKFKLKNEGDSNWEQIVGKVDELKQSIASIDSQNKLDAFNQKLKNLGVTLKNTGKDAKLGDILGVGRTFKNISEVRDNIESLFASMGKVNEKSIRITGADKLTAEVKKANGEIRKMAVSLDSNGFARFVDQGIVEFGRLRSAAEGVFKGIKDMVRIYLSPQDFIRYFRQGFDAVKEIDTAMTELKKVSDASPGDIAAYFDDAVESAKELGSSVNEMIGATADWQRMGYNLPDSRELGEIAVLYKNVGDGIDVETANESLTSTMQGFQLQASEAMSVIDAFNEVSNNYAISSSGIGEALKRSAAAFNAANTDLNQSIALITAGNEIVQSPEKVGKQDANQYSNVLKIKVAISVKSQRWSRPSKDLIIIHF